MNLQPEQNQASEKCPQTWIEMKDIESLSFDRATWIPLSVEKIGVEVGQYGRAGYRKSYYNIESIIVPIDLKDKFKNTDWQSIIRNWPDSAWASEDKYLPPGCYDENERIRYPVIKQSFDTGEQTQWALFQELEVGLGLLRKEDVWILPEENDIEVAKIERDKIGSPVALLFRAEHLRDYLCARKATLLLTGFVYRDAIEETFLPLAWDSKLREKPFSNGKWEGILSEIHEGGTPYGMTTAVIKVWRESVNPNDDTPEMPHPTKETAARSESFTVGASGKKLLMLSGKAWTKQWIAPASLSPRIRGDKIECRVHFQVENQEQKTLAGKALQEYRGWLWFKPAVIRQLLQGHKSCIKWFTENTGEIGPAINLKLHFGVNRLGFVNVLGYTMAELPEWAQKLWVGQNIAPEGGISEELHMAQNLASPAKTTAPEAILWHNLKVLQSKTMAIYGQPLLQQLPTEDQFFHRVHRFYSDSFQDVCELCKELHRIISEPIDKGLLNIKIDPANAQIAKERNLGSNKRLALWLDTLGLDGRKVTEPLAGVYDLRQGNAHAEGADLQKSLALFGIPPHNTDYQPMCCEIIGRVANCIHEIVNKIHSPVR